MLAALKGVASSIGSSVKTAGQAAIANPGSVVSALQLSDAAGAAKKYAIDAGTTAALTTTGLSKTDAATATRLASTTGGIGSWATYFTITIPKNIASAGLWQYRGLTLDRSATKMHIFLAYLPILIILVGIFVFIGISRGWFKSKSAHATHVETVGGTLNAAAAKSPAAVTAVTAATAATATPTATAATAATAATVAKKEGFANNKSDSPDPLDYDTYTLLNLQPLTIKDAGFMGPIVDGSFDATNATGQALRAGFRSFIFQIDYLDTKRDPTKFADVGVPALLYRGDDGSLLSTNSADINAVAQTIANLAFTPTIPKYTEPIIIYLHILRTPSAINDSSTHKLFLSKIATALNPLAPNHLGMTPLGNFHRQKQEKLLINSPISTFEGQVIILCNADTTVFRNAQPAVDPANDLDFWVNMRVYLNEPADSFGVARIPASGVTANAIIVGLPKLVGLSSQQAEDFAAKAKQQFVIAMPSQTKNPSAAELNTALNKIGVHMVPLDIFSDAIENVSALTKSYSNMTFRPKPDGLRNRSSS